MTQTARPPTPWLVDLPPNDIIHYGRASFMRACRGHEQMGAVLSHFVYEASWKAKNEGIDVEAEDCTSITIEVIQTDVLKRVSISHKSLITYLHTFVEWGFITGDNYRHMYDVHFKKIREAIASPPEPFPSKPRGNHAYRGDDRIVKLQSRLEKLQAEMVKIQNRIETIQSETVTFQSKDVTIQSSGMNEATSEQGLEGNFETPRIYRITKDIIEDSLVASASAESDGGAAFLSSLSQFEDTLKEVQNGQTPLDVSCSPEGYNQEELVKSADTDPKPAVTSAIHDTTPLQEIPTPSAYENHIQVRRQVGHDGITSATFEDLKQSDTLFPESQPPLGNKTHKKDNRKISVLSVPKVPPRVIREAIDAIRGYALDQEGPIKHQGVILKEWCQKHTLEDFQHVIEHLTKGRCSNEKHQWWREKNHMKTFFNAAKLAELTPDILSELGHIPKPEAPPEVAPVEEPKIVEWTPVRQIYPPKGVTVTYG
jgi:hypothetical protein